MGFKFRGDLMIPQAAFQEFALKFSPINNGNFAVGPPRLLPNGDIMVPFAMNSEVHPKEEDDPPEWLKKDKKPKDE